MENFVFNEGEVRQFFDGRVKINSDGHVTFRKYSKTLNYIPSGYEPLNTSNPSQNGSNGLTMQKKEQGLSIIRLDNLARSRSLLIDLAYSNYSTWHSFVTLTFGENLTDVRVANSEFKKWVTLWKRKKSDFVYIAVPEFQKRGAVHYHVLTNLICGVDIPKTDPIRTWNKEKKKYFDIEYHDIPYWKHGFTSAFDLKLTDDRFDVAAYMCKYMYKDIDDRLYSHQKIMHSKSLKMPDVYRVSCSDMFNDFIACMFAKYKISSFNFDAKGKYQVSFFQMSVKLSAEDLQLLQNYMRSIAH